GLDVLQRPGAFVVSMKWNEAGRLGGLLPEQIPVLVFSDDPRGFAYNRGLGPFVGRDALIVVRPEDLGAGLDRVRRCFARLEPVKISTFGRLGAAELELHLFEGRDLTPTCSELGTATPAALAQWRALKAQDIPRPPASAGRR
ncbi:MAG TPA: hypothetical protein VGN89_00660, partial [Phenylobacterium sp.]|nr:hypothetical protein [Phenylobacterium sp.]